MERAVDIWAEANGLISNETGGVPDQTDEMRRARLNQPRVTSEQAHAQRELALLRRASERFSEDAKRETSYPSLVKLGAEIRTVLRPSPRPLPAII
jgi:hypothetical protein